MQMVVDISAKMCPALKHQYRATRVSQFPGDHRAGNPRANDETI